MLSLDEIKRFYPAQLHYAGEFLIREYLQCKILETIYESEYATSLVFLGGPCLRLVHENKRFSEDLDFDNKGLHEADFTSLSTLIQNKLRLEGYEVEIKVVHKAAFHCYIRFPQILFHEGLSGHMEQKILIQLDTEPQKYDYKPEKYILNRFDVFTELFITPFPLLLAQKIYAVLNRQRNKGRDFFDIIFLLSHTTTPDWNYLAEKTGISGQQGIKNALLEHCQKLDMAEMARDVEPFLFQEADVKKVIAFPKLIQQVW